MALLERDSSFYDETEGFTDYTSRDEGFGERITYVNQPDYTDPAANTSGMDLTDEDMTTDDSSDGFHERLSSINLPESEAGFMAGEDKTSETGGGTSDPSHEDHNDRPMTSPTDHR